MGKEGENRPRIVIGECTPVKTLNGQIIRHTGIIGANSNLGFLVSTITLVDAGGLDKKRFYETMTFDKFLGFEQDPDGKTKAIWGEGFHEVEGMSRCYEPDLSTALQAHEEFVEVAANLLEKTLEEHKSNSDQ